MDLQDRGEVMTIERSWWFHHYPRKSEEGENLKKIKLPVSESKIDINGEPFDIVMTEADLNNIPIDLREHIAALDENNAESLTEFSEFMTLLYSRVLGEGAYEKIFKSKPLPLAKKVEYFMKIFESIMKSHIDALAEEYE